MKTIELCLLSAALVVASCADDLRAPGGIAVVPPPQGNTGVSQGGAQDFGRFRQILEAGEIPGRAVLDEIGFFNEHKLDYADPTCGEDFCVHGLLGVRNNMISGSNCTLIQLGMNSPIDLRGMNRPPMHLVLTIDVSGSMAGEPIRQLKLGLERMLEHLSEQDSISVVAYSDRAEVLLENLPLGERERLLSTFRGLSALASTNIYDGLFTAFDLAEKYAGASLETRVMLLSDGVATSGIQSSERMIDLAEGYAKRGIALTTVGIGDSFDLALMRDLSSVGAGNFYFLENAAAVSEVFEQEITTFLYPVALDVQIDAEIGGGYALRRIYGARDHSEVGEAGRINIPSLFLASRLSSEEPVEGGRRGGGGAMFLEMIPRGAQNVADEGLVGDLTISWTDPRSGSRRSQRAIVRNERRPGEIPEGGIFTDRTVEKGFVMLNLFVAFQIAADLSDQGDLGRARVTLEAIRPEVAQWLEANPDVDIQDDLKYVDLFIANLAAKDASALRTASPPEPWPAD